MKRTITISLIFIMTIFLAYTIYARSKRVGQIPNGNVNGCANCHVSASGGGARNAFGQMVGSKYLDRSGDVIWGAELANEDADGDGFTNGEELQDSAGTWTGGAIGDPALVFNPGDANSHPPVTSVNNEFIASKFVLEQNYPNPFNPTTTIRYSIPVSDVNFASGTNVKLVVYDVSGSEIATLVNDTQSPGNYEVEFNAVGFSSGIYFYRLTTNNVSMVKRMILMK